MLIVDAYHEMDDPTRPEVIVTLLRNVARVAEAAGPPRRRRFPAGRRRSGPAPQERVDPEAVIATASAAGLNLQAREPVPPFSSCWSSATRRRRMRTVAVSSAMTDRR